VLRKPISVFHQQGPGRKRTYDGVPMVHRFQGHPQCSQQLRRHCTLLVPYVRRLRRRPRLSEARVPRGPRGLQLLRPS
jgi:hypothetical protein